MNVSSHIVSASASLLRQEESRNFQAKLSTQLWQWYVAVTIAQLCPCDLNVIERPSFRSWNHVRLHCLIRLKSTRKPMASIHAVLALCIFFGFGTSPTQGTVTILCKEVSKPQCKWSCRTYPYAKFCIGPVYGGNDYNIQCYTMPEQGCGTTCEDWYLTCLCKKFGGVPTQLPIGDDDDDWVTIMGSQPSTTFPLIPTTIAASLLGGSVALFALFAYGRSSHRSTQQPLLLA